MIRGHIQYVKDQILQSKHNLIKIKLIYMKYLFTVNVEEQYKMVLTKALIIDLRVLVTPTEPDVPNFV